MAVFDTPDGCVERLEAYRQALGFGRLVCWFDVGGLLPHTEVVRSMERFAAEVLPHLGGAEARPLALAG
jgi:hypothetical protein